MESLIWLLENIETVTWNLIVLAVCGIAMYLYAIWCFIKSAVRSGVEEALQNISSNKTTSYLLNSNSVKKGILDALKEMDGVEIKYHNPDNEKEDE